MRFQCSGFRTERGSSGQVLDSLSVFPDTRNLTPDSITIEVGSQRSEDRR